MGEKEREAATPGKLDARRSPMQDRAKQTVAKILEATAELLDDTGHEKLTTERVAEQSGLNIATIYHYFPNKEALFHALFQQHRALQQERLEAIYSSFNKLRWRDASDQVIDTLLDIYSTTKGAMAIVRAVQNHDPLREIDHELDLRNSAFIGSMMAEAGISGSSEELQAMALVLTKTAGAVLENSLRWDPENAASAMEKVKLMQRLYIEYWIERSAEDSSSGDGAE